MAIGLAKAQGHKQTFTVSLPGVDVGEDDLDEFATPEQRRGQYQGANGLMSPSRFSLSYVEQIG